MMQGGSDWFTWTLANGMHSRKEVTFGRKSAPGSFVALVGRLGVGQLLCSIPPRAGMVMGDVLAGRRRDELDRCAVASGSMFDPRSSSRSAGCAAFGSHLDLSLIHI